LVVVESPELGEAQLDLVQKRAAAASAAHLLDTAKSSLDRANKLYEGTQGITLTELQKRETDFKTAEVNVRTSKTAASAAENRLHLLGMSRENVDQLAVLKSVSRFW